MNRFVRLLLISLAVPAISTQAQKQLKVYYLVVGSADYEHDSRKFREKDFIPYDNLPEANASAEIMKTLLERYAGGKGISLYSSPQKMITKQRLLRGMDSLELLMRKERPVNPLVVLYYCGHGISENLGWNQFLVPGNYTAVAGTKNFDALGEAMVHLSDITDKLDKAKRRYVLLVDCCRKEEQDNSLPEARLRYFFSPQNVETFKTIVVALKYINEYHAPDPVVFSIAPGFLAATVDIPAQQLPEGTSLISDIQIGPICRRTLLVLKESLSGNSANCTLEGYIRRMTDPTLDALSATSVSHYEADSIGECSLFGALR